MTGLQFFVFDAESRLAVDDSDIGLCHEQPYGSSYVRRVEVDRERFLVTQEKSIKVGALGRVYRLFRLRFNDDHPRSRIRQLKRADRSC